MKNMNNLTALRRENLKKWFENRTLPLEDKSYFSQLINGKSSFGEKAARRIEKSCSMPEGYLDTLHPSHVVIEPLAPQRFKIESFDIKKITSQGTLNRGEFSETLNGIEYQPLEAMKLFRGADSESLKIITVRGDSMKPTLEPNDLIVVDISKNEFESDGLYVFVWDGNIVVKRFQQQLDRIAILSDNTQYQVIHLTQEEVKHLQIVGKVVTRLKLTYDFFD